MILYFFDFAKGEKREEERGKHLVVALYFFDFFEEREEVVRVMGVVEELCVAFVPFC